MKKFGKLYIGSTSNMEMRLGYHNKGRVRSTKPYIPYKIICIESCKTKTEALKRERQIKKSGKLRKMLKYNHGPIV